MGGAATDDWTGHVAGILHNTMHSGAAPLPNHGTEQLIRIWHGKRHARTAKGAWVFFTASWICSAITNRRIPSSISLL